MELYEKKTVLKAFGQVIDGKANINMSGIYTVLIQNAGRWCEHYASDILYDIQKIETQIQSMEFPEPILICFRKMGVDGNVMYKARTKNESCNYLKILELFFEKTENSLTATLVEII